MTKRYQPKLSVIERNKKKAVFVEMPDGTEWNVCDLQPKQCVKSVLDGIAHAIELGFKMNRMLVLLNSYDVMVNVPDLKEPK